MLLSVQSSASHAKHENENSNVVLFDLREQSAKDQESIEKLTSELTNVKTQLSGKQKENDELKAMSASNGDVERVRKELQTVQHREKTELATAKQSLAQLGGRMADIEVQIFYLYLY